MIHKSFNESIGIVSVSIIYAATYTYLALH